MVLYLCIVQPISKRVVLSHGKFSLSRGVAEVGTDPWRSLREVTRAESGRRGSHQRCRDATSGAYALPPRASLGNVQPEARPRGLNFEKRQIDELRRLNFGDQAAAYSTRFLHIPKHRLTIRRKVPDYEAPAEGAVWLRTFRP